MQSAYTVLMQSEKYLILLKCDQAIFGVVKIPLDREV